MNPLNVTSSVLHYCGAETLHIKQSSGLLQSGLIREGLKRSCVKRSGKLKLKQSKKGLNLLAYLFILKYCKPYVIIFCICIGNNTAAVKLVTFCVCNFMGEVFT